MPKQMIEIYNEETDEYEKHLQNVTPFFEFFQSTDEEMAAICVCTKEFLGEYDEPDDNIDPSQFSTVFVALDEAQGKYRFVDTDLFMFHEGVYGTWCVAELKNGKYDFNGEVNVDALVAWLESHGFKENPGIVSQYF